MESRGEAALIMVVSDLHLEQWAADSDRRREFLGFLEEVRRRGAHLIVNGDLMDLPPREGRRIEGASRQLLARIVQLGLEEGGPARITWVVGNHDIAFRGLPMRWRRLQVIYPAFTFEWAGRRVHIEHGHYYDPLFWGWYEMLGGVRQLTGCDVGAWAKGVWTCLRHLGSTLRQALGEAVGARHAVDRWQAATRDLQERVGRADAPAALLRRWAAAANRLQEQREVDYVLFGHTHTPIKPSPGSAYINTGDWLEHRTVTLFAPGTTQPHQIEWGRESSFRSSAVAVAPRRHTDLDDGKTSLEPGRRGRVERGSRR